MYSVIKVIKRKENKKGRKIVFAEVIIDNEEKVIFIPNGEKLEVDKKYLINLNKVEEKDGRLRYSDFIYEDKTKREYELHITNGSLIKRVTYSAPSIMNGKWFKLFTTSTKIELGNITVPQSFSVKIPMKEFDFTEDKISKIILELIVAEDEKKGKLFEKFNNR